MSDAEAPPPPPTLSLELFTEQGSFLVGAALDAMFYGFFVAAFMVFIAVHRYQGKKFYRGVPNIAVISLFILCTGYVAMDIYVTYLSSFDLLPQDQKDLNTAISIFYAIIDFIGQVTLIYRCWILWNHNFAVVIVPFIFSILTMASVFTSVALIRKPVTFLVEHLDQIRNLGFGAFFGSLVVNALVMGLIVARIYIISRAVPSAHRHGDNTYRMVLSMLLESGLTLMVAQLIWTVLFRLENPGFDAISGAVTQLYGITACVLMIRVTTGASYDSTTKMGTSIVFQPKGQQSRTQVGSEEKSAFSSTHVVVTV